MKETGEGNRRERKGNARLKKKVKTGKNNKTKIEKKKSKIKSQLQQG